MSGKDEEKGNKLTDAPDEEQATQRRSLYQLTRGGETSFQRGKATPHTALMENALDRRSFLKLMGASLTFAGLTACNARQPVEKIVPYVRQPEDVVLGKAVYYATAMTLGGYATGLLVESHEGRPTKIEGNPDHPASLGATDAFAQASVLTLYDPDRSQTVRYLGDIRSWDEFLLDFRKVLAKQRERGGAGLRILTETVTSPTLADQLRSLQTAYPQAVWHQYEPVNRDNVYEGAKLASGSAVEAVYHFDKANVVLALDADFVNCGAANLHYARDFMQKRRVRSGKSDMNRLYVVECAVSNTGAIADHRLPIKASAIEGFARAVAAALGVTFNDNANSQKATGASYTPPADWLAALVRDLRGASGTSIIIAGEQQPPVVHAIAHALNQALGNVGKTVVYTDAVAANPTNQLESLRRLVDDMDKGSVEVLVIIGGNPVYTAPADFRFAERLAKVGLRMHQSLYYDETSANCQWHIPATHYLEEWSDARAFEGTVSIIQPLIAPLYDSKSAHEILAAFSDQPDSPGYDIIRNYWMKHLAGSPLSATNTGKNAATTTPAKNTTLGSASVLSSTTQSQTASPSTTPASSPAASAAPTMQTPPHSQSLSPASQQTEQSPNKTATTTPLYSQPANAAFEKQWQQILRLGIVPDSTLKEKATSSPSGGATSSTGKSVGQNANAAGSNNGSPSQELEIVFRPDPTIYDGRFANNGWLQELPKPLTKLAWDNAALISPATAQRLGLSNSRANVGGEHGQTLADVVELNFQGNKITAPVWIMPGHADDALTVTLGYGRTRAGNTGNGAGFNAYTLRTSNAMWVASGIEIRKTGERYALACTQAHHEMEGREPVRVATLNDYHRNPEFAKREADHPENAISLYPGWNYDSYAWGMAIDTGACVGCNACVVACQAENNIPVVGKEEVSRAREMHWLRIDRYYTGNESQPQTLFQPVLCMHCENAPCELVCPVEATSHSSEGLNEMTYNRCVGTRYCSNNCPYKVRRFNFFSYADYDTPVVKLQKNPDVTVRSRGVMEKCTYCVQRINHAKIEAEIENRSVRDGEIVTACQSACPTEAIIFGNINDVESRVAKLKAEPSNYGLLAELNTRPRTTYLATVRNPNPEIKA
jgi:molybdopterin-containing oxidoreductase family iron-sulfur binding subunit